MFIEVNSQEQLSQVRTCLMTSNAGQDLKQKNCLSLVRLSDVVNLAQFSLSETTTACLKEERTEGLA